MTRQARGCESAHRAAQAAGPDAAHETGDVTKPPEGRGSAGLTERLAAASARRARRVLAAEVRK